MQAVDESTPTSSLCVIFKDYLRVSHVDMNLELIVRGNAYTIDNFMYIYRNEYFVQ